MAEKSNDEMVDDIIDQEDGGKKRSRKNTYVPLYKMVGDTKVPVAKATGTLWKGRRDAALGKRKTRDQEALWDQAIRYYRHDHLTSRTDKHIETDPVDNNYATGAKGLDTENIVFANVSALVPAIYAKNPSVEASSSDESDEEAVRTIERLINTLFRRKTAPGVNLKPKARKAVVMTTLTNLAWLEVGYTLKEESSQHVMDEINALASELDKAKDEAQLRQTEAKLEALEKKVSVLSPAGPFVRFRNPKDVLLDPDVEDRGEVKWMMCSEFMSTELIRAIYGEKDGEEWKSIYQPTHVLRGNGNETNDEIVSNFSLIQADTTPQAYGYNDEHQYNNAKRTKVWRVWDKTTRRVLLYNDQDWSWPIWVWDDPYRLDNFFPFFPLEFYTDPEHVDAKSEVAYYLDMQDSINQINAERRRWRMWASSRIGYNSNVIQSGESLEKFLSDGNQKRTLGFDVPPDTDMSKLFTPMVPPSAQVDKIFDKAPYYQAIDRLSSVNDAMRGVEFKTNTTNKAIETYTSQQQTRLDEKIDAIEDLIGAIGWAVAQLCQQFMEPSVIADLLGPKDAEIWTKLKQMSITDFQRIFDLVVVGGSAQKPTSVAKKEQALQLGQVVGQFAKASPAAVLVTLKVLERAFDEFVITKEDWSMISESIMAMMNKGRTDQEQGPQQPGKPGQPQQQQQQQGEGQQVNIEQLEQLVDSLPQPVKVAFAQMIGKGMPIRQAVAQTVKLVEQAQRRPQPGR